MPCNDEDMGYKGRIYVGDDFYWEGWGPVRVVKVFVAADKPNDTLSLQAKVECADLYGDNEVGDRTYTNPISFFRKYVRPLKVKGTADDGNETPKVET